MRPISFFRGVQGRSQVVILALLPGQSSAHQFRFSLAGSRDAISAANRKCRSDREQRDTAAVRQRAEREQRLARQVAEEAERAAREAAAQARVNSIVAVRVTILRSPMGDGLPMFHQALTVAEHFARWTVENDIRITAQQDVIRACQRHFDDLPSSPLQRGTRTVPSGYRAICRRIINRSGDLQEQGVGLGAVRWNRHPPISADPLRSRSCSDRQSRSFAAPEPDTGQTASVPCPSTGRNILNR